MRRAAWILALCFPAAFAAGAPAALVLTDGRVIEGTEIVRQGESFLVTQEGGNTITFPVLLVKEIRIGDSGSPKAPPGFDYSGPKTLAGPKELPSQDPRVQQRALGPPTRWSKDALDTSWVPTSPFDPDVDVLGPSRARWAKSAVDTTWVPKSVFDLSKDVLAGSRSTWSKDAVSTAWAPKDSFGFKNLYSTPPAREVPALSEAPPPPEPYVPAAAEPPTMTPWSCAEKMMKADDARAGSLEVHPLKGAAYEPLGLKLYEAVADDRRAIFSVTGGECRLVGGDTDALVGLNLTADHAMAQAAASVSAAMKDGGRSFPPPGADRTAYAFALVSLTDPKVSGSNDGSLVLVAKPDRLRAIVTKPPEGCAWSKTKRRKEERTATSAFAPPKSATGPDGETVTFLTWSSAGGIVYRNTVLFAQSGGVSTKREIVASHLGDHRD